MIKFNKFFIENVYIFFFFYFIYYLSKDLFSV